MTSADSLRQVLLRSSNSVRKASQGKNTIFPVIYLPHLHREFRIAWGFSFLGNLTHSHMPDAVPVRRTNGLPRASFRYTLAFGYALGAIPCARDFHPLDCAHAWHNRVGGVELFPRRPLTPPTVPFGSGRFLKFYFHSRGLVIRLSQHQWCFARNFGSSASLTIGVLVERQ